MNYKTQKVTSLLLGLARAAGTIITAVLVAKETPKALKKINVLKKKKDVKKIDYAKELIPVYWPAGVVCLGTIMSTTISQVLSMKAQASLIATSTLLQQGWNRYKDKIKDTLGFNINKKIENDIATDEYEKNKDTLSTGEMLFWEEHVGFFSCKKENLISAMSDLNQRLHTPDSNPNGTFYWTSLYFLMKDAKADVLDKNKIEGCKKIGWTTDYLCDVYKLECMWVHPFYTRVIKKDTGEFLFTKIGFFEEPIFLQESERSRYHYKSRADYEHEAECDMHDIGEDTLYSYSDIENIERDLIYTKPDCNSIEDDGRRFIPSNLPPSSEYIEDSTELPTLEEIPILNN